jgi:hypothetical protein
MKHHSFMAARFHLVLLMLILLVNIGAAQTAPAKPISEKGLTDALKIGGLEESELITAIKTRGVDFALTAQTEKGLRTVGASNAVINAVRANYRGAIATPVQPQPAHPQAPSAAVAQRPNAYPPGVYFLSGSVLTPLPVESIEWKGAGLMRGLHKASIGLLNEQMTGNIAGSHSGTSIHIPVSFLMELAPGTSPDNYLLLHLHGKHDDREFKSGLGGDKSSDEVAFQATKTAEGKYQISCTPGSGDYAFVQRSDIPKDKGADSLGKAFTFRVPD